ncbi:MAG: hypothetical protein CR972_00140 [Candidatus Moraniibacteriota bacterium]|nr:MAG: hypothetical protein CR972_00140 [Candidatus Moranbacteria bacterium]
MKKLFLIGACLVFFVPTVALGVSGTNIDETYVKIKTKQGGEWFTTRKVKTDDDGVLRLKDVLPGKYKFTVDNDDEKSGQSLGLELRMQDEKGRRIKDKIDVKLYAYINNTKTFIKTVKTDKKGWLDIEGVSLNMIYELNVKDNGSVKSKDGLARIKTKAKIKGSDWFQSSYDRLEADNSGKTNGVLEMKNVIPGKYKFKLKSGDPYDSTKPFIVHAQMRKDTGKRIKKSTKVKIYAYIFGTKTIAGEVMTDDEGWILLPEVRTNMKYRLKVKD